MIDFKLKLRDTTFGGTMKKTHAQKWIDALRSGKYKQGIEGHLRSRSGYCCLGVLDEIFPKLGLAGGSPTGLLRAYRIGLHSTCGHLEDNVQSNSFACLNDKGTYFEQGKGYITLGRFTFDEIADIIQLKYIEGADGLE